MEQYRKNSLTLGGTVAMGTGVMIGAGIFALTGQMAEMAGGLFPLAFLSAALVTGFSAYSYVKMSNAYPSAGGIGMYLYKAYGNSARTAACALLMYFSMVINESLVARTFGTYVLQIFNIDDSSILVPTLGVGLLVFAFLLNLAGNRVIGGFSMVLAVLKVGAVAVFALVGLWVARDTLVSQAVTPAGASISGFIGATALGILAFKGFTTITNSGSEIVDPHRNVGRAIIISIAICVVLYLMVALAVSSSLPLDRIIATKNYSLAEAARPALGSWGLGFTVALAVVATISGVIASIFAVSRMLAMLTDMKLVPHRHFGMPGTIQKHTLVYTVVFAILLTVFFDLGRIASIGAIFYVVMDIAVHWGILRYLRGEISAKAWILITAILLDVIVLGTFIVLKWQADRLIVIIAVVAMIIIFLGERLFVKHVADHEGEHHHET